MKAKEKTKAQRVKAKADAKAKAKTKWVAQAKAAKSAAAKRDKKMLALVKQTWRGLDTIRKSGECGKELQSDYMHIEWAQTALATVKGKIELRQPMA